MQGRIDDTKENTPLKLDKRDEQIIAMLAENARTSLIELGKALGTNKDTVRYKIQRLEKLGIIQKYYAEIDLSKFGYFTYHIFMLLDELGSEQRAALLHDLVNHPNTKSVIHYNDRWDLEWTLVAKGMIDFDAILTDISTRYAKITLEKEVIVVIKYYPTTTTPFFPPAHKRRALPRKKLSLDLRIDAKDFLIIKWISEHARMSAVELGQRIGLSSDSVIRRLKILKESGLIDRFTILCNETKIGLHWQTVAVQIRYLDQQHEMKLKAFVLDHPYIIRCVRTIGTWDLLMYIAADTNARFHSTAKEIKKLLSIPLKSQQAWAAYKEECFINFPRVIQLSDYHRAMQVKP
ncbi:winged helix-turn-helix transcriptional regulator [Candidatus Woesearchaeota archaeon]|nr:winged helix-turn-helix transcriptional regulator [Candidatus Woesearchaeota archaeon]